MKTIQNMGAQGDVLFRRIDKLPAGVAEQKAAAEGHVVAHSETGHHHTVSPLEAKLFDKATRDPMICYLQLAGDFADVVHHRPHDTHETLRLAGGAGAIYEVRRQEEYTPEGWRRVED
jgi:hypothetical protein